MNPQVHTLIAIGQGRWRREGGSYTSVERANKEMLYAEDFTTLSGRGGAVFFLE